MLKLVPDNFKEIRVPDDDKLVIILLDETVIEKTWQNKSRSESWTKEMREKISKKGAKSDERSR